MFHIALQVLIIHLPTDEALCVKNCVSGVGVEGMFCAVSNTGSTLVSLVESWNKLGWHTVAHRR